MGLASLLLLIFSYVNSLKKAEMTKITISILFLLSPIFLSAQNFCTTGGAQGGALGVSDCYPYNSPCPEESNAEILLILDTDLFASEISWQIQDLTDVLMLGDESAFENDSIYYFAFCAQRDHCYHFAISDSAGNGLDPLQGGYSLYWNGDLIQRGTNFGVIDSLSFGACCSNFKAELLGGIPCNNYSDGQVIVETSGGTPPYDYLWSNGDTFTEMQSVKPGDGSISVLVKDASNCIGTDSFQPTDLQPLKIVMQASSGISCQENSGVATVSILSGVPPFAITWSNGGTGRTEQNLAPGTYYITVTDASSCTKTDSAVIVKPPPLESQISITDVSCAGDANGSIDLSVSGGTLPYSFLWSNGLLTEDLSDLGGGDYSLIVTDADNCLLELDTTIIEPDSLIIEVDSVFSETNNDKDGAIQVSVS